MSVAKLGLWIYFDDFHPNQRWFFHNAIILNGTSLIFDINTFSLLRLSHLFRKPTMAIYAEFNCELFQLIKRFNVELVMGLERKSAVREWWRHSGWDFTVTHTFWHFQGCCFHRMICCETTFAFIIKFQVSNTFLMLIAWTYSHYTGGLNGILRTKFNTL